MTDAKPTAEERTAKQRAWDYLIYTREHSNQSICLCESCVSELATEIRAAEQAAREPLTRTLDKMQSECDRLEREVERLRGLYNNVGEAVQRLKGQNLTREQWDAYLGIIEAYSEPIDPDYAAARAEGRRAGLEEAAKAAEALGRSDKWIARFHFGGVPNQCPHALSDEIAAAILIKQGGQLRIAELEAEVARLKAANEEIELDYSYLDEPIKMPKNVVWSGTLVPEESADAARAEGYAKGLEAAAKIVESPLGYELAQVELAAAIRALDGEEG